MDKFVRSFDIEWTDAMHIVYKNCLLHGRIIGVAKHLVTGKWHPAIVPYERTTIIDGAGYYQFGYGLLEPENT